MATTANHRCHEPPPPLPGFAHISRYWDDSTGCYAAKLLPGEYYVTVGNEVVVTVLGSCISACVRDPVFGIGGMNHFMLPENRLNHGDSWQDTRVSASARYGNVAMEQLINTILRHGGSRQNLEIKIFGGGRILASMTDVGRKNIDYIQEYVRSEHLKLAAEDVGDIYPRKVRYYPATGKAQVRKLRSLHNDTIIRREKTYIDSLASTPIAGNIELF